MPKTNVMQPNADLWGLNPQTGRPYSTQDRRFALSLRGIRNNIGGPAPSMMWDDFNDRVQGASTGVDQGQWYQPGSEEFGAVNQALMERASSPMDTNYETPEGPYNPAMNPASTFNTTSQVRPALKPLQGYGGYTASGQKDRTPDSINSRRANFYPNAGKR